MLFRSHRTVRTPIVSILHVAYAFLPVGFVLIAAAAVGWLDRSTALHALTVGVIGCAIIAMVTRTALGHTGRRLETGRMEHLAYLSMALAAVVRVAGPLLLPDLKPHANNLLTSGQTVKLDIDEAFACGQQAVKLAESGTSGVMVTIDRTSKAGEPYATNFGTIELSKVAIAARPMPPKFISRHKGKPVAFKMLMHCAVWVGCNEDTALSSTITLSSTTMSAT
mgnify:CR=1 FL=1